MPVRYYFNLTDGHQVIHDPDGVQLSSLRSAMLYAFEVVEELGHETSSLSVWRGWTLEILDGSGCKLSRVALDDLVRHPALVHEAGWSSENRSMVV